MPPADSWISLRYLECDLPSSSVGMFLLPCHDTYRQPRMGRLLVHTAQCQTWGRRMTEHVPLR